MIAPMGSLGLIGKSLLGVARQGAMATLRNPTVGMYRYGVGGMMAGALYGAFSDDTSVLGGAAVGGLLGSVAFQGRLAGSAALAARASGTGVRGFGRQYMAGYLKSQGRLLRQTASAARNIGGLLNSHIPVNFIKGLSSSSDRWLRSAMSYGRRTWGAGHAISRGAPIMKTWLGI